VSSRPTRPPGGMPGAATSRPASGNTGGVQSSARSRSSASRLCVVSLLPPTVAPSRDSVRRHADKSLDAGIRAYSDGSGKLGGESPCASACSSTGSSARSTPAEADAPRARSFASMNARRAAPLGVERVGVRWGRSNPTSPTPPLPPLFPPAETQEGWGGGGEPGSHKQTEGLYARVRDLPFCDLVQHLVPYPLH
jgi:hypothetical protein